MKIKQNTKTKSLGHVMLDLETMGKRSNSPILSIGAVEFDINTGETGDEFYSTIDLQSCLNAGLEINGETVYWWLTQNEKARQEVAKGGKPLNNVLVAFMDWFEKFNNKDDVQIWGNGTRFDIGILEDAYVALGYDRMPWNFRGERDLRTLVSFAPEIKTEIVNKHGGAKHMAIDDCKIQIEYASKIWNIFFRTLNEKECNHGTKTSN